MWSCGAYDASFAVQRKQLIPLSIRVPLCLLNRCTGGCSLPRARKARQNAIHTSGFSRRVFHRNGKGSYVKRTIARGFHGRGKDFYKAPFLQGSFRTASFFRKQSRKSGFDCANHGQSGTSPRRLAPTRPAHGNRACAIVCADSGAHRFLTVQGGISQKWRAFCRAVYPSTVISDKMPSALDE